MATTDDIAFNQRILQLADSISRGDTRIRNAMESLLGSQKDLLDEYITHLDNTKTFSTKEEKEARERLIKLKSIALTEDKVRREYTETFKKSKAKLEKLRSETEVLEEKRLKNETTWTDNNQKMLDQKKVQIEEELDNLTHANNLKRANLMIAEEADKERATLEAKQNGVLKGMGKDMMESIKEGIKKNFGKDAVVQSLKDGYETISAAAATSTSISVGNIFEAAKMGMKPQDFIKMQAEFGRTESAMIGGQDAFVASLKEGGDHYRDMIVDAAERTKLVASQMQILTDSGIRPSTKNAAEFASTVHRVSGLTHKTAEQITSDLASIQEDESTQTRLKMASSETERMAIIESTQAVYANNIAIGMSTKQAVRAATELNKLQTQTAKSRITESARIRALGGALGMGGQAAELARIRTKGMHATPEELKRATEISAAMSQKVTQMRGGTMAQQLTVEGLTEGLKLDESFGPNSAFNNTLGAAVAPIADGSSETIKKLATLEGIGNEIVNALLKNPLLMGILGGVGMIVTELGLGKIKTMGKGLFGGGGGGATKTAEKLEAKVAEKEGIKIAEKAATKSMLKKIPVLGMLAAAVFAGQRAMGGDLKGASMELASGALATGGDISALGTGPVGPVAGNMASMAVDAALAKRDYDAATTTPEEAGAPPIADSISDQLKKMDMSNDFLKTISDNSVTTAEYLEKLLYVSTMSDKDRQDATKRDQLLKDNRFGSQYGYTM